MHAFHLGEMADEPEQGQVGREDRGCPQLVVVQALALPRQGVPVGVEPPGQHESLGKVLTWLGEWWRIVIVHGAHPTGC
jgi:hypothetical protein